VAVVPCVIIKHARFYECQNVYYVFECIHRAPRLLNLVDVTDNTPNRSWHRLFCLSYSDRSSSFYRWKRRYIAAECSTRCRCDPWQVRWFSAPAAYEFFLDSMVLRHLGTQTTFNYWHRYFLKILSGVDRQIELDLDEAVQHFKNW